MSIATLLIASLLIAGSLDFIPAFEVAYIQYYFWFKGKLHRDWILDKFENIYSVRCLQKCRGNSRCTGLALVSLEDDRREHERTCYLLKDIGTSYCTEDGCEEKDVRVYHMSKPLDETTTTTEVTTSVKYAETSTTITSTVADTSTTTETTKDITVTTSIEDTTITAPATQPSSSTTTEQATTEYQTSPVTTSTLAATISSTESTEIATTEEMESTTVDTTSSQSTAVEDTTYSITTTFKAETSTDNALTTAESTSTEMKTSTTEATSTTEEGTTTTGGVNSACGSKPGEVSCLFAVERKVMVQLKAVLPLFTDGSLNVDCNDPFGQDIFTSESVMEYHKPFGETLACSGNQMFTGLEFCLEDTLVYLAVKCTNLADGFSLELEENQEELNNKDHLTQVGCGDEEAIVSLRLTKNSEGMIIVSVKCGRVKRNQQGGI